MALARELDAAGITDPDLRAAYTHCHALQGGKGSTYFLATWFLPAGRRPFVYALYNFGKWVDDIVDDLDTRDDTRDTAAQRLAAVDDIEEDLCGALGGASARHPVNRAVADTAGRFEIPTHYFTAFLAAMRSDLTGARFATYSDLRSYIYGAAEVFGLGVLPVLGTVAPREQAAPYAAALAQAFQVTNILRDVAEDLDLGRIYLPDDLLAAHGVDHDLLRHCRRTGVQDARVRAALAELAQTGRAMYRRAEPGCALLAPMAGLSVAAGLRLYQGVLDEIVKADFDVWTRRHRVPTARRIGILLPALGRSAVARVRSRPTTLGPVSAG